MDSKERNQATRRLLAMTGLCALAVVCNVVVPSLFWDASGPQRRFIEPVMFAAFGALVGEFCLLGIWCGLSLQPIKHRLPVTVALVLVGACSYSLGLQLPDWGTRRRGMPVEAAVMLVVAAFGLFLVMQVPLWLMRRAARSRISIPEPKQFEESPERRQFSVGYLMLWMTLAGLLLFLLRNTLPEQSQGGLALRDLVEIVLVMLVYIGLASLICIPCVWIVLLERPQLGSMLLFAGAFIAGPFIALVGTSMIFGRQDAGEMLSGVTSFEVGLAGTTLAVLLVLRSLGYRLQVVK